MLVMDWKTMDVTPKTEVRPPTLADRVHEVMLECLYGPTSTASTADAVLVEGIVSKYGFDPKKLATQKPKIEALIDEIVPESFYSGMSFLSLCEAKNGEHWAEHRTMESLYVLAAAIGRASFCAPREMWPLLPGGVPYLQFTRR